MIQKRLVLDCLKQSDWPILDVRSPAEYAQGHIPGAISLPIFSNDQRANIGTIYKQKSREEAIKTGLEYFGPQMKSFVEQVEAITSPTNNKKCIVHCWRGGMRSGAMAWLLDFYGFDVWVIEGGYKAYRNLVLQQFEKPYNCTLIGGYTGSGKTILLHSLKDQGHPIIDLEALANHQGSAYGGIGRTEQPSQEMFENLLASQLLQMEAQHFFMEDEAQRIGNKIIPNAFWNTMRKSKVHFYEVPFNDRLQNILKDYGQLPIDKLQEATLRIAKRLGPNETKMTLHYLQEGEMEKAFEILLKYYDKYYMQSLYRRENAAELIEKKLLNC